MNFSFCKRFSANQPRHVPTTFNNLQITKFSYSKCFHTILQVINRQFYRSFALFLPLTVIFQPLQLWEWPQPMRPSITKKREKIVRKRKSRKNYCGTRYQLSVSTKFHALIFSILGEMFPKKSAFVALMLNNNCVIASA